MSKARFLADLLSADGEVKASKVDAHSARKGSVGRTDLGIANQEQLTVDSSGNLSLPGTVDGVDIAARDSVLTSTTTTAGSALPKAGGTVTGATTFNVGATFGAAINVAGTIVGDDGLSIQGGAGNAYLQVGSNTGSWTWKNYQSTHKLALEDSDGTGEVLSVSTAGALVTSPSTGGHAVFNEGGVDADFRVESNANTHMLFVDASTDRVRIGGTPGGSAGTAPLVVMGGEVGAAVGDTKRLNQTHFDSGANNSFLTTRGRRVVANNSWTGCVVDTVLDIDNTAAIYNYLTYGINELVVNDSGGTLDFRVESDTATHALFVQGSDGGVGVGTGSPAAKLHVYNSAGGNATDKASMLSEAVLKLQPNATNSTNLLVAQVNGGNGVGLQVTNGPATANWDLALSPFGGNVGIGTTSPAERLEVEGGGIAIIGNHQFTQNGVGRRVYSGNIAGNGTVSVTVNHSNASSMNIRCAMQHYGIMTSYGAVHEGTYGNGSGGIHSVFVQNHTSTTSGGWTVSRVDSTNITISKYAGTYNGGGMWYIIVEGSNLIA